LTAKPWTKWYWSDHEGDERLRLCSLAAQGLWMRMQAACWKGEPHGHLAIAGEPLGVTDIAQLGNVTETEAATLVAELERRGVFSRDRTGRIYSRRMVRDLAKSRKASRNGKKGGNPTLCKKTEKPPPVNPGVKGGVKPQRPEARSQKGDNRDRPSPSSARDPAAARRIVEGFDKAIIDHFGEQRARPWPHPSDLVMAGRWLDDGIGADVCIAVIDAVCLRRFKGGGEPPGSLKYFDRAVQEGARTRGRSPTAGGYDPGDVGQRIQAERHAERVKDLLGAGIPLDAVKAGGDWGALSADDYRTKRTELVGAGNG